MRITYLSTVHSTEDTRVFDRTCVSLAKHHRVRLLAIHPQAEVLRGVRIIPVPNFGNRLLRMTVGAVWIYLRALAIPTDLYITVAPENLWVAWLLKRTTRARVVHEMHEHFDAEIASRFYLHAWMVKPVVGLFKFMRGFVLPRLDGLIAASPPIAEEYSQWNKNTTDINNFPLPVEEEPLPWEQREHCVGYVGKMLANRGFAELVQAMEHVDARLHLIGQFDPPELQQELERLPGWSKVTYHGFLPPDEARAVMRRCKVGVITLLPGGHVSRSYPNKIFEYMAWGLPQVASDFAVWRRLVADNGVGVMVNPADPVDVARGINALLADEDTCKKMIATGRELHKTRYNWQEEEIRLGNVYRVWHQKSSDEVRAQNAVV